MRNLDQIRAAHAIEMSSKLDKKDITKIPGMIVNNGFLSALAFAEDKKEGLLEVFKAIQQHLGSKEIALLKTKTIATELSEGENILLRRVTSESLVFLSFLKRFSKAK